MLLYARTMMTDNSQIVICFKSSTDICLPLLQPATFLPLKGLLDISIYYCDLKILFNISIYYCYLSYMYMFYLQSCHESLF
jgi:hypothetical protein